MEGKISDRFTLGPHTTHILTSERGLSQNPNQLCVRSREQTIASPAWSFHFSFAARAVQVKLLSEVQTPPTRRCYSPLKIFDHNFIRIPGQSPFRQDGFNYQGSHRHLARDLRLSIPEPAAPLKGQSRRLRLRKLLLWFLPLRVAVLWVALREF